MGWGGGGLMEHNTLTQHMQAIPLHHFVSTNIFMHTT